MGDATKSGLYPKLFFSVLFLAILLLAFYITKPFLAALITGALIAYLSYPLYKKTESYIKNKSWAAFIVTIFIVLIFTVPSVLITSLAFREAQYYTPYMETNGSQMGTNFLKVVCKNENWALCRATNGMLSFLPRNEPDYYINAFIQKTSDFIIKNVEKFISSLLSIVFDFFIMVFIIYYLYKDGYSVYYRIKQMLPVKESHKERVLNRFHGTAKAIFYGNISTAVIQGILGSLGFLILGFQSPFLWGLIMALFAFVPYIGTAIVWLPAALNLMFIGYLENSNLPVVKGAILFAYGIFVLSAIDHFLKPKIIGDKAEVHPILVLIGVLGGLKLFGFIGIILGPVILALVVTFVDIYEEEQKK